MHAGVAVSSLCVTGREAFIKEQMQKRLGKDADEAVASGSQLHPDDELYAVPSDLQVSFWTECSFRFSVGP